MKNKVLIGQSIGIILSIILGIFLVVVLRFLESVKIVPGVYDEAILLLIAIFITYLVTKFFGNILYGYSRQKFNEANAKNFKTTFEIIFFTSITAILIFTIGTNITVGLVSAGFVGIILGIAAQSILTNFFAGFYIIFAKPFNIGERVTIVTSQYNGFSSTYPHEFQVPEFTGIIEEIGFLYTKIINDEYVLITIPNGTLINAMIYNYSRSDKRIVRVRFDLPIKVNVADFKERFKESFKNDNIRIIEIRILNIFTDHLNIVIVTETSKLNPENVIDAILNHVNEMVKDT